MLRRIKTFDSFVKESVSVNKVTLPSYEDATVEYLPYSKNIGENSISFQKKLVTISKSLGIDPKWLMVMLKDLSGFNHKQDDRGTKAKGLLKFFPWSISSFVDTETGKPIKAKDILEMDNMKQLDIINSYYQAWIDKMGIKKPLSPGDFAAITFYPSIIKKDWEYSFPDEVIRANSDFFSRFSESGTKTKKKYYDYIEQVLRDPKETDARNIFGDFTGAIFDPYTFNTKNSLEKYKMILDGLVEDESEGEDADENEKELKTDTTINYEKNP